MKLLRKITKIDRILLNIEAEQSKKFHLNILEPQNTTYDHADNTSTSTSATKSTTKIGNIDGHIAKLSILTTFKQLWHLLAGMRRKIPALFLLMLINSLLGLISISLIIPFLLLLQNTQYIGTHIDISQFSTYKRIIIQLLNYMYTTLHLSSPYSLVMILGGIFILIFVFRSIFDLFTNYKTSIYSANAARHFSSKIFSVLLYISYTYYLGRATARTLYAIQLAKRNQGILLGLLSAINDLLFMLIIGLGVVFWTPSMILVGTLIFIIAMLIWWGTQKELKRISKIEIEFEKLHNRNVYQGIHNFTYSRLFHSEPFFLRLFHNLIDYAIPFEAYKKVINSLPRIILESLLIFSFIGYTIFITMVSPENVTDAITTAGVLGAAILKLMPASLRFAGYIGAFSNNQIIVNEFYTEYVAALKHTVDKNEYPKTQPLEFKDKIVVKNLKFAYPKFNEEGTFYTYVDTQPVLRNISLTIKKGEKIGFIGSSGDGKTTLINLLMAFLEPTDGTITVDGVNIHQHMRKWHKNIGYVSQDPTLMSGTILENVAFGIEKENIDDNQVVETLKTAQLWNSIKKFPKGIHTDIGDLGKRLSGGQRQRLGIARALYRKPSIIFLDEATSNLDQKTEKEVQKAIDNISNEITMVIIAHRLNTLEKCNRIYCISKGRIAFNGTYKQMIEKYGDIRHV